MAWREKEKGLGYLERRMGARAGGAERRRGGVLMEVAALVEREEAIEPRDRKEKQRLKGWGLYEVVVNGQR